MTRWRVCAAVLALGLNCGCGAKHEAPRTAQIPKPADAPRLSESEKKLDGTLLALTRAQDPPAAAKEMRLEERESKIKVEIVATSKEAVAALKTQLQTLGAGNIQALENHIWAYIPIGSVTPLSQSDLVWSMSVSRPLIVPER